MFGLAAALALMGAPASGTVVMVHGAGGGGWEYDFWKPVFERAGWTVVARDLVPVTGGYAKTTFKDYSDQVTAWAKKAQRPLVMVGASMGGGLVLSTSGRIKPDLLVLVDSVAPTSVAVERKKVNYPDIVRWANGPLKDTQDAMPDSDAKTVNWAWKKWRDESGLVMGVLANGVEAPPPKCPVLVVWGRQDTDVPLETGQKLAELYGADFRVYARTSHVGPLMGRRAKEVARDTLSWVVTRLARKGR